MELERGGDEACGIGRKKEPRVGKLQPGKKKREDKVREKKEKGGKEKEKGWTDRSTIQRKQTRVAAKSQGVGKEKGRGNPRVWRLGGLGPLGGI